MWSWEHTPARVTRMTARPRLRGAGHRGPHCCRVCHSCADVGLLLGPTSTSPPLPPQHNSTATQARRSEYVLEVFIDYKMCYALKFSSYFVHEPALFSGHTCSSADNRQHGLAAHVLLHLWILLMSDVVTMTQAAAREAPAPPRQFK